MGRFYYRIVFTAFLFCAMNVFAALKVNPLFGENMVLQRKVSVPVYGTAQPGGDVEVSIAGQVKKCKCGSDGKWKLLLDPEPAGGPFVMTVKGEGAELKLKNIMFGDVWVCSGQSNMVWLVSRSSNAAEAVKNANYPDIRLLTVGYAPKTEPKQETRGVWNVCSPKTVEKFSGVAYFFGLELYKELKIPIGLIVSAVGGTPGEAWVSVEALRKQPELAGTMEYFRKLKEDYPAKVEKFKEWKKIVLLPPYAHADPGDKGLEEGWEKTEYDDSSWQTIVQPGIFEKLLKTDDDGSMWLRKTVEIPAEWAGKPLFLKFGRIQGTDCVWFNGVKLGASGKDNPYPERVFRSYTIKPELFKAGKAVIALRIFDAAGKGGIDGPANTMILGYGNKYIKLAGDWKYKKGVSLSPSALKTRPICPVPLAPNGSSFPGNLFNGMINPLVNFPVKGVVWYQGEANGARCYVYRYLLKTLIKDWRNRWNNPGMPFLIVQLANYSKANGFPVTRESQFQALELPNTGLVVTIDAGDPDNIHPKNKEIVGKRLALAARKTAYGEDIVFSGPVFKAMKIEGNKALVSFDHIGGGLVVGEGAFLKGFVIAGKDKVFYPANAVLKDNTVIVSSEKVKEPVAVRYAWAPDPSCDLYNKEGLPAVPFRTDKWPVMTQPKQ